jgi:outer membrane immunogenic protein
MVTFFSGVPTGVSTPSFTANGWFLGGGLETSVMPGWFVRAEYRYAYYRNTSVVESPNVVNINFKPTVQTVTGQLVYKFNGGLPAPVYPATPVMATNWTGVYVNGGIGYGLWAADSGENNAGTTVCSACVTQVQGGKGWLGVVGVGYDYQITPTIVAGVFGDGNFSSLKGTIQDQQSGSWSDIKQTSAWAVGPRLGWLPSPQTMTYVNGGYTSARFSGADFVNPNPTGFSTQSFTTDGWFVGGGVETTFDFFGMLGKGWFWRNEYRYASYRSKTLPASNGISVVEDITFKPTVQTVTSEIVFKFN